MADNPIDVYLNDHLAGATLGSDLAEEIGSRNRGTALGQLMESLAPQIEQDRQTLIELMGQLDTSKNPVKQATAWITEKASRAKFSGMTSGEPELGTFMALETLAPIRSQPTRVPRRRQAGKSGTLSAMLEMRGTCERCARTLALDGPAMICSYECTFCTACSSEMADICPNCSGRLVPRPPQAVAAAPIHPPDPTRAEQDA